MKADTSNDIAIVGISGLFPKAPNVETYWNNILNKVNAIGEPTSDWLGDEDFFDAASSRDDLKIYTKHGGFLNELSRFDPRPFGTMPIAVAGSEPDQFLALKGAMEALADAGYENGGFDNERAGIILGHAIHANRGNINGIQHAIVLGQTVGLLKTLFPEASEQALAEVEDRLRSKLPNFNVDTVPGLVPNMMTGRIANRLDLMGTNYIMDAACASSLLAIDAAITELRSGRADLMLAGGVNTTTSTLVYAVFCQLDALSRTSSISPFGKAANGTLLGEGQGIVVLKRMADALRDGDRIYAVVKAVGSSSDGRATGLMAPRIEGEVLAMTRAYQQGGIDPSTIGLVEAHGTGIPLGDRTEIEALRQVFGDREKPFPTIALGSVKSMIGHCIPAAGIASVIKVCMALHHKVLPPTLVEEVNPDLEIDKGRFYVNSEAAPWVHAGSHRRRAGVNAFGFGGINSHVILEEAPGGSSSSNAGAVFNFRPANAPAVVALSADSRDGLLSRLLSLKEQAQNPDAADISEIASQALEQNEEGLHRLAMVIETPQDLVEKLDQAIARMADPDVHQLGTRNGLYFTDLPLEGKIAFLFPGENSQYPDMLKDLAVASPAVREWFDMLEGLFLDEREIPHRVLNFPPPTVLSDEERSRLHERLMDVDSGSESMFFGDQALFTVLTALGIHPHFMVGHSTGENAALIASGMVDLSREQVGEYIRDMNRIFRDIEGTDVIPKGTMLSVGALSRERLLEVVEGYDEIQFTMDNCPNQAILFGPDEIIKRLSGELTEAGAVCIPLPLSWAYHTPFVAPMAEAFAGMFSRIKFGSPATQLYSCASAKPFPKGAQAIRRRMAAQYVEKVRFTDVIERLYQDGARIFVEVGPSGTLTGFVRDILGSRPHLAVASNVQKRSSLSQLSHLVGQLFVNGVNIDPLALYPAAARPVGSNVEPAVGEPVEPHLANELPFIKLNAEEALSARQRLGQSEQVIPDQAGDSEISAIVDGPSAGVTDRVAEVTPWQAAKPRGAEVLAEHFKLMQGFLHQQERVMVATLEKRASAGMVEIQNWNGAFAPPSPTEIRLAAWSTAAWNSLQGAETLQRIARQLLSSAEFAFWRQQICGTNAKRQKEWILGRVVARNAVQDWMRRHCENGQFLYDFDILCGANGDPIVTTALSGLPGAIPPAVSISHTGAVAIAAVSDQPVGIDLERTGRLEDPDGFSQVAFCASERNLAERCFADRPEDAATMLWGAKEAAAKSLRLGLLGQQQAFRINQVSAGGDRARVSFQDGEIDVQIRTIGDLVCCLAHPA